MDYFRKEMLHYIIFEVKQIKPRVLLNELDNVLTTIFYGLCDRSTVSCVNIFVTQKLFLKTYEEVHIQHGTR